MTGAIAVILVFGGLIFFHELGHFLVARAFSIGVKTFSLGFGPALASFKRSKTRYQIAVFPLGGFVSLVGESPDAEMPEGFTPAESFALRPAWQRFLVIAAGSVFNLLLAWFICWGLLWTNGRVFIPPVVNEVIAGSPAARSPLRAEDRILTVDGQDIRAWADIPPAIQRGQGKDVRLTAQRPDGTLLTFSITPVQMTHDTGSGQTIQSWSLGIKAGEASRQEFDFFPAARGGLADAANMAAFTWGALRDLATRTISFDNVGGPILIAQTIYNQASHGIMDVLLLAALISVNLGILNLLPIPVLDGGHLLFLAIEMVIRRPLPAFVQEKSMLIGLFLLLSLIVAATFNDIMRFFK